MSTQEPTPKRRYLHCISHARRAGPPSWCPVVDWAADAPPLPPVVDLRPLLADIAIYDQGTIGSCTANALCVAFEADVANHDFGGSRLFLYYNERLMEDTTAADAGAQISDGVLSLQTHGICPEEQWPYDITQFATAPPPQCYDNAQHNRAAAVHQVSGNLQSLQACLARGKPFVVGIAVFASLESPEAAATGVVAVPSPGEQSIGGHAVLVVGYDDTQQHFIVRNSWGSRWGDAGHFYLPYAYLTDPALCSDVWCIDAVACEAATAVGM